MESSSEEQKECVWGGSYLSECSLLRNRGKKCIKDKRELQVTSKNLQTLLLSSLTKVIGYGLMTAKEHNIGIKRIGKKGKECELEFCREC